MPLVNTPVAYSAAGSVSRGNSRKITANKALSGTTQNHGDSMAYCNKPENADQRIGTGNNHHGDRKAHNSENVATTVGSGVTKTRSLVASERPEVIVDKKGTIRATAAKT